MPRFVPTLIAATVVATFSLGCFMPACGCGDTSPGDDDGPAAVVCPVGQTPTEDFEEPSDAEEPATGEASLDLWDRGRISGDTTSGCNLAEGTDEDGAALDNVLILVTHGLRADRPVTLHWDLAVDGYTGSGENTVSLIPSAEAEGALLEIGLAIPWDAEGPVDLWVQVIDADGVSAELFLDFGTH